MSKVIERRLRALEEQARSLSIEEPHALLIVDARTDNGSPGASTCFPYLTPNECAALERGESVVTTHSVTGRSRVLSYINARTKPD